MSIVIVNKVKVNICGKEYSLQTDESPVYITELAARVETEINTLLKSKPGYGLQNAAVFVALTSLDEAHKASESIANIRKQIKAYVDDAAKARSAKDKLTARIRELEDKIAALEKENKELKKRPVYECEQLVLDNTVSPEVTVLVDKSAEDKAEKSAEVKEDKPAEDKADKSAEVKEDKSAEIKEEKSAEDKAEKPAEDKADKPAEDKADKPAEVKEDKPTDNKAETVGGASNSKSESGSGNEPDGGTDEKAADDGAAAQNDDLTARADRKNRKKKR